MKTNKEILVIPKYRLSFDNGLTIDESNLWLKYNNYMLYRNVTYDCKLFYRIIPYLIIESNGYYLVFKMSDGRYSFNGNGLAYVKENIFYYEPIKSIVAYNASRCGVKDLKTVKDFGFIKTIKNNPDDIAIVYRAKVKEIYDTPQNAKWMTYNELIDKCRKFDNFGIEYIDYLVSKKLKK